MTLSFDTLQHLLTFGDPDAKFEGMVDTRVRAEDFECDPALPNPASCPGSGCRHCKPISDAADPPGAMVDTEDVGYQLSFGW